MKIVVLDGFTLNPGDLSWSFLESFGKYEIYDRTSPEQVVERVADAEIVLTNKVVITPDHLEDIPSLKYIGVLATGYNVVDLDACRSRGITVTNVPGYSGMSVPQLIFSLLLEIANRVDLHSQSVHAGEWSSCVDFCYMKTPQLELDGLTFGLIGYGNIGMKTAAIAESFGMKVLVSSRTKKELPFGEFVELEQLYAKADVISLCCPLTDSTHEMINKDSIARMKDGVIIINTGRGPLINEQDVADALESEKLGALGADVLSTEPPSPDNPLIGAKNAFITPHYAWATSAARKRLISTVESNIKAFVDGNPVNVVS